MHVCRRSGDPCLLLRPPAAACLCPKVQRVFLKAGPAGTGTERVKSWFRSARSDSDRLFLEWVPTDGGGGGARSSPSDRNGVPWRGARSADGSPVATATKVAVWPGRHTPGRLLRPFLGKEKKRKRTGSCEFDQLAEGDVRGRRTSVPIVGTRTKRY